jgi:hypothetical protein
MDVEQYKRTIMTALGMRYTLVVGNCTERGDVEEGTGTRVEQPA